jgi:putative glutamine amidotransferase
MTYAPLILTSPSTAKAGEEFYDYSISLSDAYTAAVIQAGGIPVVPPCAPDAKLIAELVARTDGVLLSGGDDISPTMYLNPVPEELAKTCGEMDPKRDEFEKLLIEEVFRQRKPLLAICRGHQMVNIVRGGTLLVDIPTQAPSEIRHSRMDLKDKEVHPIHLEEGSMFAKILGTREINVNSTHHQAIGQLAPGLKVVAKAADGIVEAIELCEPQTLPYFLGVQFHPERLIWRLPAFLEVFRTFAAACAAHRQRPL